MDGVSRPLVAGRNIKRGRGGASVRGRLSTASKINGDKSVNRKFTRVPLFQPASDGEDSSDGEERVIPGKPGLTKMRESTLFDTDAEAARKSRFETPTTANQYLEVHT